MHSFMPHITVTLLRAVLCFYLPKVGGTKAQNTFFVNSLKATDDGLKQDA